MSLKDNEKKWILLESRKLISNRWLELEDNDYQLPNQTRLDGFCILKEREGVNVVAITTRQTVLLVRQYRPAVDAFVYDFPAGIVEVGDNNFLERAQTELLEETGFQSGNWQYLGKINPAPHRLRTSSHCFLALDAKQISIPQPDSTEFLTFEEIPVSKLSDMVFTGEFNCAVCIASFFKAVLRIMKTQSNYLNSLM